MDKNAIKKYAVWARRELISRVSQRAALYEITSEGYGDQNANSVHGRLMSAEEKKQRSALIAQIKEKGYEQVMEEIAYTWFNRFSALRFMEVNGYLPTRIRVFTNDDNAFKPQILDEAINMEMDGLDLQKVYDLKNANDDDALFKYMIITQCNALSSILPGMFQRISDYTELLFPDNLLREGSVVEQMIAMIPQDDWTDQVEIIGWLYQAYYSEPKDERINAHKKYNKQDIPYVTQLFTPDWIVKYMVENTLGRLWQEGHPNAELKAKWKYYLEEEQEAEVSVQLKEIRKEYAALRPENILAIDPCQGSGHILVYMFDVLVQIYEAYGYSAREAASFIVERNIWGLDIDERAAQLAYFSVMMKARQYDRRFFNRAIQPHVYAIQESNNLDKHAINYYCNGNPELIKAINTIVKELYNAKEYGSLLKTTDQNWAALYRRFNEIKNEISIYKELALELLPIVQTAEALSKCYNIVITNPPYMGASLMPADLKSYINKNYSDYKSDIFAAFIVRCVKMCKDKGQIGLLSPYVWMFLTAHEKLRSYINSNTNISSLIQLEYNAFEAACVPVASFTLQKISVHSNGDYIRLSDFRGSENQAPKTLEAIANPKCGYRFKANQDAFAKIPGAPIAYWVSKRIIDTFDIGVSIDTFSLFTGSQNITADNEKYLREIWEIDATKLGPNKPWSFYIKGGQFRKWYGNIELAVDWSERARNFYKSNPTSNLLAEQYRFKEGITYTELTSSVNSFRYLPPIAVFDKKGPCIVDVKYNYYCLGFFNSIVAVQYFQLLNPTVTLQVKDVKNTPIIIDDLLRPRIEELTKQNVQLAKEDWDSFETSWDFKCHPFMKMCSIQNSSSEGTGVLLSECYSLWETEANNRFEIVKKNEEEINRLFIHIYGMEGELNPEVADKDITIRKADLLRDVKSFISYAVGCMFGRFSLDTEGLAYAGGEWNESLYTTFKPDKDGIIPVCDDEYFDDDITGRFIEFVKIAFGADTLERNLQFISNALGGKGQPRSVIRNYFINNFFVDHCADYAVLGMGKRPVYWLFDSGRKNGFKCLIYMHRYKPDTIARIRTDYVHEQQSRYRTVITDLEQRMNTASTSERVKISKRLSTIQAQAEEIRIYEEKIHHLADKMIRIDLDDGFKANYALFKEVLAKIK